LSGGIDVTGKDVSDLKIQSVPKGVMRVPAVCSSILGADFPFWDYKGGFHDEVSHAGKSEEFRGPVRETPSPKLRFYRFTHGSPDGHNGTQGLSRFSNPGRFGYSTFAYPV